MKFLILILLFSASSLADDVIDWSIVSNVEDLPGFWDEIIPELRPQPVINARTRGRIIGGWEVEPHSHPYAASILSMTGSSGGRCGASIISFNAVITAAHCVARFERTLIQTGVHNIDILEPTQQRRFVNSEDYRIHENFNPSNLNNDISVLIMRDGIAESPEIRYVRLPHEFRNELFVGELVSIVGWGITCPTCQGSSVLRGVQNNIITNVACRRYYGDYIVDHMMCMQTTGQRGTCSGDSGGPYTLPCAGPSDQLQYIQVAVHSFGSHAGCDSLAAVGSVRLTSFLDWLDINMKI